MIAAFGWSHIGIINGNGAYAAGLAAGLVTACTKKGRSHNVAVPSFAVMLQTMARDMLTKGGCHGGAAAKRSADTLAVTTPHCNPPVLIAQPPHPTKQVKATPYPLQSLQADV